MGTAMTAVSPPTLAVMAVPSSARNSMKKKAMNSLMVFRMPNTIKLVRRQVFWRVGEIRQLDH